MKSLQISFEAVAPLFLMMVTGYILNVLGIVRKVVWDGINKLIFRVFLPMLLFNNVYQTDKNIAFDYKTVLFCAAGILLVFVIGYFIVCRCTKKDTRRGVMLQGFFRSNVAFLGIPLVGFVCGKDALGLASLTVAVVVPLVNILAVICLERFRHGKPKLSTLFKGIITNPLVLACVLGGIVLLLDIRIPKVVSEAISGLAGIATPLAMVALGAGFTFTSLKGYGKEIFITVTAKLVMIPMLAVITALLMGFRGKELVCVLCTFATPVAVASYPMAQQMDGDEKLASHIVVLSSTFCIITLFLWIFALDFMNFA